MEKKKIWTRWWMIVIYCFVGLKIIGAILPDSRTDNQNNLESNSQSLDEQDTASSVSKSWHEITSFSGSGDKTTDTFMTKGSKFKLTYTLTGTNDYSIFSFFVYPEGETTIYSEAIMTDMGAGGTDSTISYHGKGNYYLKVISANINKWNIVVEDYY